MNPMRCILPLFSADEAAFLEGNGLFEPFCRSLFQSGISCLAVTNDARTARLAESRGLAVQPAASRPTPCPPFPAGALEALDAIVGEENECLALVSPAHPGLAPASLHEARRTWEREGRAATSLVEPRDHPIQYQVRAGFLLHLTLLRLDPAEQPPAPGWVFTEPFTLHWNGSPPTAYRGSRIYLRHAPGLSSQRPDLHEELTPLPTGRCWRRDFPLLCAVPRTARLLIPEDLTHAPDWTVTGLGYAERPEDVRLLAACGRDGRQALFIRAPRGGEDLRLLLNRGTADADRPSAVLLGPGEGRPLSWCDTAFLGPFPLPDGPLPSLAGVSLLGPPDEDGPTDCLLPAVFACAAWSTAPGTLEPLDSKGDPVVRRQNFPHIFQMDGAFLVGSRAAIKDALLLADSSRLAGVPHEGASACAVRTSFDLLRFKALLASRSAEGACIS